MALQIRISGITAEHVCGLKVLIKSVADEARRSQYSANLARPSGEYWVRLASSATLLLLEISPFHKRDVTFDLT